ncbi:hypothetical protein MTO96_014445 [Rhipicephalus appendiculatus]
MNEVGRRIRARSDSALRASSSLYFVSGDDENESGRRMRCQSPPSFFAARGLETFCSQGSATASLSWNVFRAASPLVHGELRSESFPPQEHGFVCPCHTRDFIIAGRARPGVPLSALCVTRYTTTEPIRTTSPF